MYYFTGAIRSEERRRQGLAGERDEFLFSHHPEFRAAFVSYLEWGTRLAMHNSQPGADIAQQAPVPRWGWGVAPPYQP